MATTRYLQSKRRVTAVDKVDLIPADVSDDTDQIDLVSDTDGDYENDGSDSSSDEEGLAEEEVNAADTEMDSDTDFHVL